MSAKRPAKRRRLDPSQTTSESAQTVQNISDAVTAQVLENLKAAGIVTSSATVQTEGASTSTESRQLNLPEPPIIHIPAQNIVSTFEQFQNSSYKPLGRSLYSKINAKLQEKIRSREFVDMSDILVDHQPAELNLHLAVKNQRVGLTSSKKKRFLNIESWTDAFCIFASVVRRANPSHPTLSEDLAIYMDLVRQIHRDGGDWFFYDVNFRQAMQNDDTLSWSFVDQVLHTRALNRHKQNPAPTKPFLGQAPRKTCFKFNGGRDCDGACGYLHACYHCKGTHPMSQCTKQGNQPKWGFVKKSDTWGIKKSHPVPSQQREQPQNKNQPR
uniref:Uncharacterized protein LOC111116868 n=1 Tax=Crassostrea virginica TaxID=6565 RepID=A0A8B8C7J5_CRAVI|nr:uncharacterized protein LOC111116868 [Crassostrea virginica]XP_022311605.1 uncharacterized protein LOC111116868 [Crassostrea virginica]XP_022311606.1 uncharacterized protein LOC111116868 [Crassostrea virginica]